VQNSLEDLVALISFIRSSPLDDLYKFRKHIVSPLVRGSENGVNNLRILLDSVCLRRTKQLLNLPEVKSEIRLLSFSANEEHQYVQTREKLIKMVRQGSIRAKERKGNLGVFQIQLQLRRLCNHGTFQKLSLDAEEFDPDQTISQLKAQKEAKCENCKVKINKIGGGSPKQTRTGTFTVCGHLICMKCVGKMKEKLQKLHGQDECFKCSLCKESITGDYFLFGDAIAKTSKVGSGNLSPWQYFDENGCSTKISAIIADIEKNETEGKRLAYSLSTLRTHSSMLTILSPVSFFRVGQDHWISLQFS
jgi:hypothetical protein